MQCEKLEYKITLNINICCYNQGDVRKCLYRTNHSLPFMQRPLWQRLQHDEDSSSLCPDFQQFLHVSYYESLTSISRVLSAWAQQHAASRLNCALRLHSVCCLWAHENRHLQRRYFDDVSRAWPKFVFGLGGTWWFWSFSSFLEPVPWLVVMIVEGEYNPSRETKKIKIIMCTMSGIQTQTTWLGSRATATGLGWLYCYATLFKLTKFWVLFSCSVVLFL